MATTYNRARVPAKEKQNGRSRKSQPTTERSAEARGSETWKPTEPAGATDAGRTAQNSAVGTRETRSRSEREKAGLGCSRFRPTNERSGRLVTHRAVLINSVPNLSYAIFSKYRI